MPFIPHSPPFAAQVRPKLMPDEFDRTQVALQTTTALAEAAAHGGVPSTGQNPMTGKWHAIGYGVTTTSPDCSAALQSAINDCATAGGGVVQLEPGRFNNLSGVTIPKGVVLEGSSERTSELYTSAVNVNGVTLLGASAGVTVVQAGVRHLKLTGPGKAAGGTGVGLRVKWCSVLCFFENLTIVAWGSHGAYQEDTYSVAWRDCLFVDNGGDGFHGVTNINQTIWDHCIAITNTGCGYYVDGGTASVFLDSDGESNTKSGIELRYTFAFEIVNGDFEQNGQNGTSPNIYLHWRSGASDQNQICHVTNNNITGSAPTAVGILVDGSNYAHIEGNNFGGHTTAAVQTTANSSRLLLGRNQYVAGLTPLVDASTTTTIYEKDFIQFPTGAGTPTMTTAVGQLWWSSALSRFRIRNNTAVLDVCAGVNASLTITNVTIPANSTLDTSFALAGSVINQKVALSCPVTTMAAATGLMAMAFIPSSGNVVIRLGNLTGTAITGFSGSFNVQAIH